MNIRPVGADLYHADGQADGRRDRQTDIMKPIVVVRYFVNRSKNTYVLVDNANLTVNRGFLDLTTF